MKKLITTLTLIASLAYGAEYKLWHEGNAHKGGIGSGASATLADVVAEGNDADGSITLSTPQDIHTGADPTFDGATFSKTGITGTDNQIVEIIGNEILNTDEHLTFLRLNGDVIDPDGASVLIRGLAVRMQGVNIANNPDLQGIRVYMPAQNYEALHIQEGKINIINELPSTAAALFTSIDMNVDASSQAATGDYHALEVSTPSTPGGDVCAIGTSTDVCVIHQHIGAFGDMDWAGIYDGSFADKTTEFTTADGGGANDIEIFSDDDDYVLIADAAKFGEIRAVNYTDASLDIKLDFEYGDGSQAWTSFTPSDDTDGMAQNGTISWDSDDLTGWGTDTVNEITGLPGAVNYYWVRITRTKNHVNTDPVESIWQILAPTLYYWDKDGNLYINGLTVNGIDFPVDDYIPANNFKPLGDGGDNNIVPTIVPDPTNNEMANRSTANGDTQDMDWYTKFRLDQLASGISTIKVYTRASDFANCVMTMYVEDGDGNADATGAVTVTPTGNDTWEQFTYTITGTYTSLEYIWLRIAVTSLDTGDTADFSGMELVY